MSREKCCGSFPEYVCGDCPHANEEQIAVGGASFRFVGDGARCMGCFMPRAEHIEPGAKCPPANVPVPPPPPPMQRVETTSSVQMMVQPVVQRLPRCPSCKKVWNGVRQPRPSPDGVFCGTCNQQAFFE